MPIRQLTPQALKAYMASVKCLKTAWTLKESLYIGLILFDFVTTEWGFLNDNFIISTKHVSKNLWACDVQVQNVI